MENNINKLRTLLQKFHTKPVYITDEQLQVVFDFLYSNKFYPIKEKLAVRKSVVETVLYLKDMATRSGYDTIDKIEHYFKKKRVNINNMFHNLEAE
jgi:hypothetical protein